MKVKLFSNFTSIPFGHVLISWVTNYTRNRFESLIFDIVHRIDYRSRTQRNECFTA